jgi:hypothetical protein
MVGTSGPVPPDLMVQVRERAARAGILVGDLAVQINNVLAATAAGIGPRAAAAGIAQWPTGQGVLTG